jgi:isoamylase
MRKYIQFLFLLPVFAYGQQQTVTATVTPAVIEENVSMTITIAGSSVNESTWSITNNALYLWAWSYDLNDANSMDCPTNGTWNASSETNKFTYNSGTDTYTMTFVPQTFYARTGIGRIGFWSKPKTEQVIKNPKTSIRKWELFP